MTFRHLIWRTAGDSAALRWQLMVGAPRRHHTATVAHATKPKYGSEESTIYNNRGGPKGVVERKVARRPEFGNSREFQGFDSVAVVVTVTTTT